MSRRIRTAPPPPASDDFSGPLTLGRAEPAAAPADADGYVDRLIKYIPSDIIALYLGVTNVVPPPQDESYWTSLWIISALVTVCTPIYLFFATRDRDLPTPWSQIVISSTAFPIWVFAIGGPFKSLDWYDSKRWIAAVVISFGTFLIGAYKPAPTADQQPSLAIKPDDVGAGA